MKQLALFKKALPRRPRFKQMQVADAGHLAGGGKAIRFVCPHCGHDTGWISDRRTLSKNRKGAPCPACNSQDPARKKALEPHIEGRAAFRVGQPDSANPYGSEMVEHELWLDGWCAAAKAGFENERAR